MILGELNLRVLVAEHYYGVNKPKVYFSFTPEYKFRGSDVLLLAFDDDFRKKVQSLFVEKLDSILLDHPSKEEGFEISLYNSVLNEVKDSIDSVTKEK